MIHGHAFHVPIGMQRRMGSGIRGSRRAEHEARSALKSPKLFLHNGHIGHAASQFIRSFDIHMVTVFSRDMDSHSTLVGTNPKTVRAGPGLAGVPLVRM